MKRLLKPIRILLDVGMIALAVLVVIVAFKGPFKTPFILIPTLVVNFAQTLPVLFILSVIRISISVDRVGAMLFIASIFVSLGLVEATLRWNPFMMGDAYASSMLSRYNNRADGMFLFAPSMKMRLMKPDFRTGVYFNGYRWKHETDRWGFRNPTNRDAADVVLLGDSFIYGHGVDQDGTVGHFLEKRTGLSVVNLARQGDCSTNQVRVLNRIGLNFSPGYVIYSFYSNDLSDLQFVLTKDEMKRFIDTPVEKMEFDRIPSPDGIRQSFLEKIIGGRPTIYTYYLGGLLDHVNKERLRKKRADRGNKSGNRKKENDPEAGVPKAKRIEKTGSKAGPAVKVNETTRNKKNAKKINKALEDKISKLVNTLEWKYTEKAILQMNYISRFNGAEFIIAPIPIVHQKRECYEGLKRLALRNNVRFIDTFALSFDKSNFLPRDGHFSEKGASEMADVIADALRGDAPMDTSVRASNE